MIYILYPSCVHDNQILDTVQKIVLIFVYYWIDLNQGRFKYKTPCIAVKSAIYVFDQIILLCYLVGEWLHGSEIPLFCLRNSVLSVQLFNSSLGTKILFKINIPKNSRKYFIISKHSITHAHSSHLQLTQIIKLGRQLILML